MRRYFPIKAIFPFLFFLISSCVWEGKDPPSVSFSIATWNLENFGGIKDTTIEDLADILLSMGCDVFCMQEIEDTASFFYLLSLMPGYDGIFSPETYADTSWYQKTGIIYKKDYIRLQSIKSLFPDSNPPFIRPPLQAYVSTGSFFDFYLIVWHLKSGNSWYQSNSCRLMKKYIDSLIENGMEKDVMLVGDWNCGIYWNSASSPLEIFKNDSLNYVFLTDSLESAGISSHISGNFWDHILASRDALGEYGNGNTKVHSLLEDYLSDHLPVVAEFIR